LRAIGDAVPGAHCSDPFSEGSRVQCDAQRGINCTNSGDTKGFKRGWVGGLVSEIIPGCGEY
jgi:hypothetical protein